MSIPNLQSDVEAARQRYPDAWSHAGTKDARSDEFVRLLARDVRALHGTRWGLNGKRGNAGDLSDDILAYSGEGSAIDVRTGGPMEIIDVIARSGTPGQEPAWQVGPGGPGDRGTFVGDFTVPGGGGIPPIPPVTGGNWTAAHTTLLNKLPANASTLVIAEQFAFSFPAEKWGQKRRSTSSPLSVDTIGRQLPTGDKEAYRVIPRPAGTPQTFGPSEMNSQQVVAVTGRDHVGGGGPVEPLPGPAPGVKPYVGDDKAGKLSDMMEKDYIRGGHPSLNGGSGLWFGQIYHDYYAGMDWDASVAKHRADWCRILGISPQ